MSRSCRARWTKPRRSRAVAQRQLELTHPQTGPRRVDRHSHLASEPWGGRETRLPCGRREQTLAGERLARFEPGQKGDQAPRDPLRDAEASADSLGKYGDAQVRAVLDEWREVAGQIRVAEQKEAGRCCPLRRGQRLPLPATPKAQHDRAGLFRNVRGAVPRAVVRHEHLGGRECAPQRRHASSDHQFLITYSNKNRQRLIHPWSSSREWSEALRRRRCPSSRSFLFPPDRVTTTTGG